MIGAALIVMLASLASAPAGNQSQSGPRCQTKNDGNLTITCNFTPTPHAARGSRRDSPVAVTRAVVALEPDEESILSAELTFTNTSAKPIGDAREVYLAIDDEWGNNYVRRVLPHVDFRKLSPGTPLTFSEKLRVARFPPGHYTIQLWIPDPDPALKFNPAHNFLLSSAGVANPSTGLNVVGRFAVERDR